MKRVIQIFLDTFSLSFLLIIFVVPVLVAFNLDPRVYKSEVLPVTGTDNVLDSSLANADFIIEESILSSNHVLVKATEKTNDSYIVDLEISAGDPIDDIVEIGRLVNQADQPIMLLAVLLLEEPSSHLDIWIKLEGNEFQLLQNGNLKEISFELLSGQSQSISLRLDSDYEMQQSINVQIEIEKADI